MRKKTISTIKGWAFRIRENGPLFVSETKPERMDDGGIRFQMDSTLRIPVCVADGAEFPEITAKSQPVEVEIVKEVIFK